MKFKVVGKSLILTDYSHKITEGENSFDIVEIAVPNSHDDYDLSTLSFRFSETSEDGKNSAVQILRHTKCDEKYIYLKGTITSDFSAITGKVRFILTGINDENIVAKFQSDPFTVSDDISLVSLPNETTAEQIYNQTHLEAVRAAEAADRAEKFSKTPAPAEIYPASEINLGGVKVDGKTITADADGTVSVSKTIASLAVQIAHPNNYLIYDDVGKPSVMVAIPKFYLDEVIDGASHTIHPAFIINGIEQEVIYISKYQNTVENERAYSLPMKSPITNVTFDTAWNYCKNKGAGWHLMTNAEWAAVELWCKKNNIFPKGNNDYGKDISETNLPSKAMAASYDSSKKVNKTLTGSGQGNWYHDGTFAGIADLNGNVWEWNSGMRLINGKIQILENNDAADYNNSVFADSALWKEIMPDGSLVAPGTTGTLAYSKSYGSALFTNLTTTPYAAGTGAALLEALGLLPHENSNPAGYGNHAVWITIEGEKVPLRGGAWYSTTLAGIFTLMLGYERSYNNVVNGFRCAYYGSIA